MADRFWVGGTGNFSDTNKWSTTTGGAGGASVPTSSDNAIFDANSGTGTVTIDATSNCLNLDFTNSTLLTLAGTFGISVFGNLIIKSTMTVSYTGTMTFAATATGKTLTMNGVTLACNMTFNGAGGGWTLQDALNIGTQSITLSNGTLDTNGKTVTCAKITVSNNTNTRVLTLGASTINCSYAGFAAFAIFNNTNFTLNANTSTINLTGNAATLQGNGNTFNNVVFSGGSAGDSSNTNNACGVNGANTFANLTYNGTSEANGNNSLYFGANQTITSTFTIAGNSLTKRILVRSNTVGTARTITAAVVSLSNCDFADITGAGAASPFTGTSLGNALGNTSITFTAAVTRFWVGNGGNWSSTTQWSATSGGGSGVSVPLCHDTVNLDANSITSGGQTITLDVRRLGAGVSFSGLLNAPTINVSINVHVFGLLTLASSTVSGSGGIVLNGRSSHNLTFGGATVSVNFDICSTGTFTLQDNLVIGAAYSLGVSAATFDANNNNVTVGKLTTTINGEAISNGTLTMGARTWTLTGTGTAIDGDSYTITPGTSTLIISDTSTTAKTVFGGKTYNNITITGDNVGFSGGNTFNLMKLDNAGLPNGTAFYAFGTTTVSSFYANGSQGNLIIIVSSSPSTRATLSQASGNVYCNYLSITDSGATGGANWYAGSNSTNVSNNSGWIFVTPKIKWNSGLRPRIFSGGIAR